MIFDTHQTYQIPPTGSYPHGTSSLSALSDSEEYANNWDGSNTANDAKHSRHSSLDHGRHHPSNGKQLKFVIDGQGVVGSEESVSPIQWTKKDRLNSKMKVLSCTISTAIDQMTSKAYSHAANIAVPESVILNTFPTEDSGKTTTIHPVHGTGTAGLSRKGHPTLISTESGSTEFTESEVIHHNHPQHGKQAKTRSDHNRRKESVLTESGTLATDDIKLRERGETASSTLKDEHDVIGHGAGYERHQTVSIATSSRTHDMSIVTRGTASTMDLDEVVLPRSQQTLPFHWPFSSYPVARRSLRGKVIETLVMTLIVVIYVLPVIAEEPRPTNAPSNYNIWFINLFLALMPWLLIYVLRMIELWTTKVSKERNPNNRMYATFLFYILCVIYFFGLLCITVEVLIQSEWIHDHSPLLYLATMIEMLTFIASVFLMAMGLCVCVMWTFCCRITTNMWETRIDFYCCTKGEALTTKRYPKSNTKQ